MILIFLYDFALIRLSKMIAEYSQMVFYVLVVIVIAQRWAKFEFIFISFWKAFLSLMAAHLRFYTTNNIKYNIFKNKTKYECCWSGVYKDKSWNLKKEEKKSLFIRTMKRCSFVFHLAVYFSPQIFH